MASSTKYYHFEGKIEVLGQRRNYLDRVNYSYIQFIDINGNVKNIKGINVGNTVDANIHAGTQGTFYVMSTKHWNWIFAFKNDERKVFDEDEIRLIARPANKQKTGFIMLIVLGVICAPFIPYLGIPLIALGVFCVADKTKGINEASDKTLREYVNNNGFSI